MRILILVNTLQNVASFVYSNHIHFFVETAKSHPDTELVFFTPHRMSIDRARNEAAQMALQKECDYLMFIDDDVLIPSNTLSLLLEAKQDICAGLVIIRGYPFDVMAFRYINPEEENAEARKLMLYNDLPRTELCEAGHDKYELTCEKCVKEPKLQEIVPCDAVGFSCCLINTEVLKPLEPPYFLTSKYHTEDVYFCLKAKGLDPIPTIAMHTGIRCGHLLNQEPIEFANRATMKPLYEPIVQQNFKRGKVYLDQCLAAFK